MEGGWPGFGCCDNPILTECQYKAIYKHMKNRPQVTGNFSAPLARQAEIASKVEEDDKEGEEEEVEEEQVKKGINGLVAVITG